MPIELAVEADSTDLDKLDRSFDKVNAKMRDAQGRFVAAGKAAEQTDKAVRGVANAAQQAEMRTQRAIIQLQKMQGALGGVSSMASQVQGVLAGFIGGAFIGGLVNLTGQLQKIEMTFQAVAGSVGGAEVEMAYAAETADKLGQNVLTASGAYAKILAAADAAGISLQDTRNVFEGITAASTAFGLSQYELEGALNAVQQMISKGSVQAEELRGQLGERLPGAFSIAADAMNMTTQELSKALELGKVSAVEFVKAFGPELQSRFGQFAQNAETSGRAVNELENATLKWRQAIIDGGFQDALIKVLDTLTALASSQEAVVVANGLGAAFKVMAENGELAAISLGLILAAITPFGKIAALIAGASAALLIFTQRQIRIGDDSVKVAEILSAFWDSVVDKAQASGELVAAVWDYMAVSAEVIPVRLAKIWAIIQADFFAMVSGLAATWSNFLDTVAGYAARIPDIMGGGMLTGAVAAAAEEARTKAMSLGTEMEKATARAAELGKEIGGKVAPAAAALATATENYAKVATGDPVQAAVENVRVKTAATAVETEKLTRLQRTSAERLAEAGKGAGAVADATGKAAKGAKAAADEFARAKDVLADQVAEYDRLLTKMNGGDSASSFVADEMDKLADALKKTGVSLDDFLKTSGYTRDAYVEMLTATEKMTAQLEAQKKLAGEIGSALLDVATGANGPKAGIGGILESIMGSFSETLQPAFDDLGKTVADSLKGALGRMGGIGGGLSGDAVAGVGLGIASAAVGALNGSAQQIGSGLGSAAGAALGPTLLAGLGAAGGPVGMLIGGVLGSVAGGLFSGGTTGDWQEVSGRAFEGTSYASNVTSRGSVNVATDQGFSPEGRFAFDGLVKLLGAFDRELAQFVRSAGGRVKEGLDLTVKQNDVIMAIAGRTSDLPYKGEEGKAFAAKISGKVAEIMALAGTIASEALPPLTEAQRIWREAQRSFSEENVAILRDIGFTAREISKAQEQIRRGLASDFEKELLDGLVDTGRANKSMIRAWFNAERRELDDRKQQAMRTAREIGASLDIVRAAFKAENQELNKEFRELTETVRSTGAAAERAARQLDRLQGKLDRAESRRAEVMAELTRRADEARRAEEALGAARANLAASELAPGGPLDRLRELQTQFNAAIKAARGGDASAASTAASLASGLLQQGQTVFASGDKYAELFKMVNAQLMQVQGQFGNRADRIENRLDAVSMSKIAEQNTAALLRALGRLDTGIREMKKEIEKQTKKMSTDTMKKRVA